MGVLALSVLFALLVYFTTPVDQLPSMSFSHGQTNEFFYFMMHYSFAFALWAYFAKTRENAFFWAANGIAVIASASMHLTYWPHAIATVLTMLLALWVVIYVARTKREKNFRIFGLVLPVALFAISSYATKWVSFYWGELAIVVAIVVSLIRQEKYIDRP